MARGWVPHRLPNGHHTARPQRPGDAAHELSVRRLIEVMNHRCQEDEVVGVGPQVIGQGVPRAMNDPTSHAFFREERGGVLDRLR